MNPELEEESTAGRPLKVVGRYALYGMIAEGGMATVHFGRLLGPVGFSRTVAIKRLHPQYSKDPEFVAMFLDEARLAARIQHPNVVATVDVVAMREELFLVMDYVRGESFARLLRAALREGEEPVPVNIVASVVAGMLHGLHAAHEARDERGQPLNVVHRDVSPQNVLVGVDGAARVLDFGVAKAAARIQFTREGQVKGKISYMSPEQLQGEGVDRRSDVFAAGIVLWEALTRSRLFAGDDAAAVLGRIVGEPVALPSTVDKSVPPALDRVVRRALEKDPKRRYQTAREFAIAVEDAVPLASSRAVGEWVESLAGQVLADRERAVQELESYSSEDELLGAEEGFIDRLRERTPGPSREEIVTETNTAITEMDERAANVGDTTVHTPARFSEPAPPPRRRRWPLYLLLVLFLGGVAFARRIWDEGQRSTSDTSSDRAQGKSASGEHAGKDPSSAGAGSESPDAEREAPTGAGGAGSVPDAGSGIATAGAGGSVGGASATTGTSGAGAGAVRPQPSPPRPRPKPKKKTKRTDCTQPFYVDKRGIRRIKSQCL